MQPAPARSRILKFGMFTADLEAGELHKAGVRQKLAGQPFEVLIVLLEHPQQIVTREELQQRIWPTNTFVDYDLALRKAIARLRDVLGDSPENPRFIETIPRKGYRFIAPVTQGEENEKNDSTPISNEATVDLNVVVTPVVQVEENGNGKLITTRENLAQVERERRVTWLAAFVALISVVGLAYVAISRFSSARSVTEKDTVVVADFVNSTRDPVFDDALKTALTISLRQSPFLNLLAEDKVRATLERMGLSINTQLTPSVTREVCERAGSKAYIVGSIASLGSQYVLGLKAVNCQDGNVLVEEQVTAPAKEKILSALGEEASKLRRELGESLRFEKYDIPLADATTTSLEALKAYSLGQKSVFVSGHSAALPYHQRAIELDPNFAMGYEEVGNDYYSLAKLDRANEYFTKAFQLREHASEPEKLVIIGGYYWSVTGELDKAAHDYQEWGRTYPREFWAHLDLGGIYALQGQYKLAREQYGLSLSLRPDNVSIYGDLANAMLALQLLEDARQTIQHAQSQELDDLVVHDTLYALAFLRKDSLAMVEQQQWFIGKPGENTGLLLASDTEAYVGHLRRARDLIKQSIESSIRIDNKEVGAIGEEIAAQREAVFGYPIEAKREAAQGLKLYPASRGVEAEAGLAFAMAGDTERAESLSQDLSKRFPLDTQIQSLWLPTIHAQLELNRKNPGDAISDLQLATPIELAQIPFTANLSCLYHTYIRGEAYLATGQGDAAAIEFQKILDHSGLVWNCWTGALAHLGVARANALEAKTLQGADANAARDRARAAYKDFLALWKDADADISVLKQARLEYEKLQ